MGFDAAALLAEDFFATAAVDTAGTALADTALTDVAGTALADTAGTALADTAGTALADTALADTAGTAGTNLFAGDALTGSVGSNVGGGAFADTATTGGTNLFAGDVAGGGASNVGGGAFAGGASAPDAAGGGTNLFANDAPGSFSNVGGAGGAGGGFNAQQAFNVVNGANNAANFVRKPTLRSGLNLAGSAAGLSGGDSIPSGGGDAPPAVDSGGTNLFATDTPVDSSGTNLFADDSAGNFSNVGGTDAGSFQHMFDDAMTAAKSVGGDISSVLKSMGLTPAQAGMLGIAGAQGLSQPKLPQSARTAMGASTAAVQQAQGILASGGTSSPQWQTAKASIDSSIDEQLRNETEALIQSAQNSGQGGRNSAVVQQRIGQLQQRANAAKQQQYNQALTSIVQSAVAEMSGGNATLGGIAGMEMSQNAAARSAAEQTAQLALQLGGLGKKPTPDPNKSGGGD